MIHFIFGIAATLLYWRLLTYSNTNGLELSLFHKILTIGGILYTVFVAEVIVGFIHEQELKAALVMGSTTGIFAIVWAVVLWRYVYSKKQKTISEIQEL